jgi:hypothetical protein
LETSWHSYPKIYALGHRAVRDLFEDPVVIEEKVDGSQFSFGIFNGVIRCKSRGKEIDLNAPEKMFAVAIEEVKAIAIKLIDGWTYRAEYLQKPKHNVMAYGRVPKCHLILFDINRGYEDYISRPMKEEFADRMGLEVVPCVFQGRINGVSDFDGIFETESILGGVKIEGIVVKNYYRFGPDGKALMAKYVSEAFKEVHQREWKAGNPTNKDLIQSLIEQYRHEGRWQKAVQHLAEREELENEPKDIAKLVREVQSDILEECKPEIIARLFSHAWPYIQRGVIAGLPEWYKQQLAERQFSE